MVIAPLQVIGPAVLDEVVGRAIYRIFDAIKVNELANKDETAGFRAMPGTNPDALETWALDEITYEHLLARLAEYPRVVLLSGDVHNAASNAMSYWRGAAAHPVRIVQFTSSGFKNVMPVYLRALDASAMLLQQLLRARTGVERLGWTRPEDDLVLLPAGFTEADLVAVTRAKLLRTPVLLPLHGWPDGAELNPARPPEWRWRVTPLIDGRPDAERPSPIRAVPLDDDAIDAQVAAQASPFAAAPGGAGPDAQHPADDVPLQRRHLPLRDHRRPDHRGRRGVDVRDRPRDPAAGGRAVHGASGRPGPRRRRPAAERAARPDDRAGPDPGGGGPVVSAGSILRRLAGEVADFAGFVGDLLGRREARSAVLRDLGGPPGIDSPVQLPAAQLDALERYRAGVDDDVQADIEAVGNLALVIGALIDQIEAWGDGDWSGRTDTFVTSLFDLLGSTYVRRRWPKLFLIMQAVTITNELTGSLGPGEKSLPDKAGDDVRAGRFFNSFATILKFVWNPGRTLDDLDDTAEGADGSTLNTDRDQSLLFVDGLIRGILAAIAVVDQNADEYDENLLADVIVGWDAAGLDVDSDVRPRAADLLASRMVSVLLRRRGETDIEDLKLSWLYLPRRLGTPSRPHQLFLALGGALTIDEVLNPGAAGDPTWRFRVGIRSDAGAAVLISGDGVEANASAAGLAVSLQYVAIPDESGVSYRLPILGSALEFGPMSFGLTLSASGARILARLDSCAIVVDGKSSDSFMRKLLGGRPYRKVVGLSLGYDSNLGFIKEIHQVATVDATGPEPPFDSTGPAGPSDLDLTLPLGGGTVLGIPGTNLHELVVRLAAREGDGFNGGWAVAAGALITFSDYFGALVLRFGKRITLTCLGLASTKDREGNPLTSFILIGTVDHLGLSVGFVTFDGFGLLYAADRTLDVPAVRAALPSGQLKHLLFPADPIKHLPEMVAGLRLFPPKAGSHIYGILVKLTFGSAHPLLRADLALMLETDDATESSRLLVLGRVSSVLPQESAPLLTLNLDVVGEFDLDTGYAALDAVLYESKLFGRFVLTGAAAFRRAPGVGFALAIGGFNPRFSPPAGFPVVPRVTVALTSGDNPKFIIEAYLAITPNTLQFGATASLYAAAYGFSIEGYVGFDVLVQFWPPHFIADFKAGIQLKRGKTNLFKVDVRGTLEGPIPLRVAGKATFGILWWDYTVGFDKTLIGGSGSVVTEALDVLTELRNRFNDPLSWRTELPPAVGQIVGVRSAPRAAGLWLHPLGRLIVQQAVVPLNTARAIDRVGAFVPKDDRRFRVTRARIGDAQASPQPVTDEFPDSQFFDLTDAERLSAPGMVQREAGVSFGTDAYASDAGAALSAPFGYTEILVGPDGVPVEQPSASPPSRASVLAGLRMGAAQLAATRTAASERYFGERRDDAPRLAGRGAS